MICSVCPGCNKEMREGTSYAYFAGRHWCSGCAKDRGYPGYPGNKVRSLYFDFVGGRSGGTFLVVPEMRSPTRLHGLCWFYGLKRVRPVMSILRAG